MATLDKKLRAITCRSSMGMHIQFDDDVQITLTDNDYIDCSSERPFYSGWHSTIDDAANAIIAKMEAAMIALYGSECAQRFREQLDV